MMTSYMLNTTDYQFIRNYKDYMVETICFWIFLVLMVSIPNITIKLIFILSVMMILYTRSRYKKLNADKDN